MGEVEQAIVLCEKWFDTGARASWCPQMADELAAALRRAKAEGEDELLKLRIYTQTLQRALRNCHMLARRIVVSESTFFKIDSANHIIRMCEEAGVTSVKGVLRDAALQPKEPKHE